MLIGVPKEIKNNEYRVGLTPSSVRELVAHGHRVIVEQSAGSAIGRPATLRSAVSATRPSSSGRKA